jgi:PhnB protein
MSEKIKPVPEGYHTATPYLVVDDAAAAIDFYKRAFGATELFRMPGPGGRIPHAELQIGDSHIMLSDEFPAMGSRSPKTIGGTGSSVFLYVEDADSVFNKAVTAGAKELAAVQDMFWGDRFGRLVDPFGHEWGVATHVEDVTPEEMGKRMAEFSSAGAAG